MPDLSHAHDRVSLELSLFDWLTIHGNVCLGLRHPANTGPSREIALEILDLIGQFLVDGGLLTAAELAHAQQVEREAMGLRGAVS